MIFKSLHAIEEMYALVLCFFLVLPDGARRMYLIMIHVTVSAISL